MSNPAKGGSTPIASRSASPKSYPSNSPPRRPDGEGSSISAYLRLRSHIAKILVQVSSAAIVSKTARSGKQKPCWVPEKTLSSYLAAALSRLLQLAGDVGGDALIDFGESVVELALDLVEEEVRRILLVGDDADAIERGGGLDPVREE